MSEISSFNRPPHVDANFQSRMVLLKCGSGSLKDCGGENANNEIPQQSQTFDLESDLNPKNVRADDFGSEGSSSEESFDAEVFDNTFETASVNSQLSALDELDELEIDNVNLVDENVEQRNDASPVNKTQNVPEAVIESATLLQQQDMYTTNVYVSLKAENKAVGKTGKIRCRVPSRDDALGTRNSASSLSTNSLASETGSESSTTFQGPGDKSHEVRVQRVSLTSLPGLDMPDFIRASMEASLEKMELRNDKEEEDEVERNEEAVAVTQSTVDSPPAPKETKSPAIRAKFKPRKRSPEVRRRGSKPQELDGVKTEKQEGKSPQSPTRKSPSIRTRRKPEPEVRPRGSKPQKANLENIKITESQIVMVVTNDQKSTSPSTKIPVLKSPSGEHIASTNELKTETLHATIQSFFSQENEDDQFVLKQDENVLPSKTENEESSAECAAAPVVSPTEKKSKIPLPLNDSMKSAVVYKTEKVDDVQSKAIASPTDDRKSKTPPPAVRQLSLEGKKDAEAPPKFESLIDVNENKIPVDPRNQAFDIPVSQNEAKTESQSAPNDPVTKPTLPSKKQSKIPLPFADSTISQSEENNKEVVVVQSRVKVASPTENSSKIPLRAILEQHETRAWLTRDSSSAEEVRSDFAAMTLKEGSIEETQELVVAKSPTNMLSSTGKVSKIPVFSKLGQLDHQTFSNENNSSAKMLSSLGMSSDRADTSRIETRITAPSVSSSEQASSNFKALIIAPGEKKGTSIATKNNKSETVTAVEDAHSNETNSVSGELISSSERKSKIPLPPCSKELKNTLSSSEDKNVKLLNSEKNKIPSIKTENKTLSLHNERKTPSQVGSNEGKLPENNSNEESRVISPTERESKIPLPTNGRQCQNTVSLKNEEPNVLKSQMSSPTERKSQIPHSRIPMPRSPATSLPTSPEDKKDIWIKTENNDGGDDSYVSHSTSATSTPEKVSIQPSKLPMATSRLPMRKNEREDFEDMYDFEREDEGQTLLQRYMMSEDRRVEEIIRHQKFQS